MKEGEINMEQIMNFFASIDWAQVMVFFCCSLVNYTPLKNSTEFSEVGASNDGITHH